MFYCAPMNWALGKVCYIILNITHACAYIHAHTRAHIHTQACTYIHCRLSLEAGGKALVWGGDYPKHRKERITKRWCNPAVNPTPH